MRLSRYGATAALVLATASAARAQAPLPGFVDNGSYTSISSLSLDVWDVDAFAATTYAEALAQIGALGPGWHLASIAEVSPIFGLLDESSYLGSARFLFGAAASMPDGVTRWVTGGRVADEPGSPGFGWLWGFGTGVQTVSPSGAPTYGWSSFGVGFDNKDTRFPEYGAWVIRSTATATTAPEPATVTLLAAGLLATALAAARRRRATA